MWNTIMWAWFHERCANFYNMNITSSGGSAASVYSVYYCVPPSWVLMYERESWDLWDIREQTGRLGDEWWSWEMGNNHYSTAACIRTYRTCTHIHSALSLDCMRCDLSPNKHAHILKRGNTRLPTGSHSVHTRKGRVIYYTGKSLVSPWGAATFIIIYFFCTF